MLKRFEVTNFKQFNSLKWDFSKVRNYDFSTDCLIDLPCGKLIKTALVYGRNSSGKSNLGFAIFDIVQHLVDKVTRPDAYLYYANADHPDDPVSFKYTFELDGKELLYQYTKTSPLELVQESLYVDNEEVFSWNQKTNTSNFRNLSSFGFKNLNFVYKDSKLSFLRYLANNSPLSENSPIKNLMDFVGSMLWFRRVDTGNSFMGLLSVSDNLDSFIISHNLTEKFENFLNEHEVKERLKVAKSPDGREGLYFAHQQALPFFSVASSGTLALTVLFYWYELLKINQPSFIFMNEFDAFYHFEVAEKIFNLAKKLNIQTILTTHNTNLLKHANTRADCCFLLQNEVIKPFSDLTQREIREGNNLEKLFLSHEFEC